MNFKKTGFIILCSGSLFGMRTQQIEWAGSKNFRLITACKNNSIQEALIALNDGADPNCEFHLDEREIITPLHFAMEHSNEALIQMLLIKGASITPKTLPLLSKQLRLLAETRT